MRQPAAVFYLMPANKKPPHRREPVRGPATEERAKLQAAVCCAGVTEYYSGAPVLSQRFVKMSGRGLCIARNVSGTDMSTGMTGFPTLYHL